ncbi:MAG: SDR family oxidoreductase [Candidatus Azambacteria bacterium]|nr:SDR family oxidoreductase [Candidatus Azambacteria bacterium]
MPKKILVIGGAGYVGSALVPKLLNEGHYVRVLDTFWFGKNVFDNYLKLNPNQSGLFCPIEGDIRNFDLKAAIGGMDAVIHLACISNDPSFELNPTLGKSINYDAFLKVIEAAQAAGVERFIFASTSSVYGIKKEENVTEDLALEPLTDYSKYKAFCEMELWAIPIYILPWVIIRPATVCGWAPRLRLDLTVNILTMAALTKSKITVFGGSQKRPNIHIDDMADLYVRLVGERHEKISGQIFNAGGNNFSVMAIAILVKNIVENCKKTKVEIEIKPTSDLRSYHISSEKIKREIGWVSQRNVSDAVYGLVRAFDAGKIPNPDDPKYSNIKTMQLLNIQ